MPLGRVDKELIGGGYYATFFEDPTGRPTSSE